MDILQFRVFLAALLAALACTAQAADRRTDELMHKSGLWTQLGQSLGQLRTGAEQAQAAAKAGKGGTRLEDGDFARIIASMNSAYAPERLRAAMLRELERLLSPEDEAAALEWLDSDLGKRLTRIEEESGDVAQSMAATRAAPVYFKTVPPARIAQFTRMVKAIKLGEATASMVINMTAAIGFGMAMASPVEDPSRLAEAMRMRMEPKRAQMAADFDERGVQTFAYVYRELTDAEVARYVAFAESPAGTRYHEATTRGMDIVLARAGIDLGREFDILKREPSTRS